MIASPVLVVLAACALSLAGLAVVWRAWSRDRRGLPLVVAALVIWAASTALWISAFGPEIGTALAIEVASLLAFAFVLSRMERQDPRGGEARVAAEAGAEPDGGAGVKKTRCNTAARVAVAGPLALAAALSLGLIVGLRAPLHEQTRLIVGGLAVPTLWALMIVTTLALRRVWPTAVALVAAVVAGALLAWQGF